MAVFRKKFTPYLVTFLGVVVVLAWMSISSSKESDAMQKEKQLNLEFKDITQLPQATLSDFNSFHKSELLAVVQGRYNSSAGFEDIQNYYYNELINHGWKFSRQEKVTAWGKDYGEIAMYYTKGEYIADIDYVGNTERHNWTYAVEMRWGSGF